MRKRHGEPANKNRKRSPTECRVRGDDGDEKEALKKKSRGVNKGYSAEIGRPASETIVKGGREGEAQTRRGKPDRTLFCG